jgi:hypothetical protein
MATKLQKMANQLNEEFSGELKEAMREKFSIEIESEFNIFSMRLVTTRVDGNDFTEDENRFIEAFSDGYGRAMRIVRHGE